MEFVKEYVFYKINIKNIDGIIVKASSDCSDRYIHSYSRRLIFNVKIIYMEYNKTNNKVIEYKSAGMILFLCRMRKKGCKILKINKLTLRYGGNIDDINI